MSISTPNKSLFGPYSAFWDELFHAIIALIPAIFGYACGLSLFESAFVFLAGAFLIDVDHVFNSLICKKALKVPGYDGTLSRGDKGYAPNIFHGFDVMLALSLIAAAFKGPIFGGTLFAALAAHLLWDFAVYPSSPSFLFLTTRASKRFQIGERRSFVGKIFDRESLKC